MSQKTFLLRAPDAQMERWKRAAQVRSMSFAAFCREALDRSSPVVQFGAREVSPDPVIYQTNKRTFNPDPKGGKR